MPGPTSPFPKGIGGNPSGRPKKTDEMRRAEELMRSRAEDGVRELIALSEKSEDDNVRARLLMFRFEAVFGKPAQAITGPDGGAIQVDASGDAARLELARMLAQLAGRREVTIEAQVVEQVPALPAAVSAEGAEAVFIRAQLEAGPVRVEAMKQRAEAAGLQWGRVKDARQGIADSYAEGEVWHWRLKVTP